MHIKNIFLRFIVSIFITITLYFLLITVIVKGDIGEVIEAMFIFAIFGLFIVGPTLVFMVYLNYQLLTIRSERSQKLSKIIKNSLIFISIMAMLYFAAMYTDLFG